MLKSKEKLKKEEIKKELLSDPVNIAALRQLAISKGGLLTTQLRQQVWPFLLGVPDIEVDDKDDDYEYESHPDYRQVKLDVDRSSSSFPKDMESSERSYLQGELLKLIIDVIRRQPKLNYYQGYHDVCVTFLLVCGRHKALPLLERLSTHHLRDFMFPTMDKTSHILNYLVPMLEHLNPELVDFIQKAEVEMIFAVSWLITWYSYVLSNQNIIQRLFDFFLSCHPLMPIYFAAHVVDLNSDEILKCECEMPYVFQKLSKSASKPNLPLEMLISKSSSFYIRYPPSYFAKNATEYYKEDLAVSTFPDYALAALQEDPDQVLKRLNLLEEPNPVNLQRKSRNFKKIGFFASGFAAVIFAGGGILIQNLPLIFEYFNNN